MSSIIIDLNILFWNARGVRSKFNELVDYIKSEDIDIIGVNETFLEDTVILPNVIGYEIIRIDKTNHSGGLLFIIKSNIRFVTIDCPATDLFDCMALRVEASHPFILTLIYCRGGPSTLITSNYQQELTSLCNQSLPFFIMGDFNSKHRAWNCVRNNKAGKLLKEFLDRTPYFLSYPLDNHTYNPVSRLMSPSTIDLLITDGRIHCSPLQVHELFTSDHYPVRFEINCNHNPLSRIKNEFYNYSRADWSAFRAKLDQLIEPTLVEASSKEYMDNNSIDELIHILTNATNEAVESTIPKYSNNKSEFIITPQLRSLITERNYFRRRFTRTRHPFDELKFKELKSRVTNCICELKRNRLDKILIDCNYAHNNIFKIIKTKRHVNLPALRPVSANQRLITSKEGKAEELANTFINNHKNSLHNNLKTHTNKINKEVARYLESDAPFHAPEVEMEEVISILRQSKTGKASGLDAINIKVVKNFPVVALKLLVLIFNLCNKQCYFPTPWKIAKTIAIPKPGKDPKDPQSYRPIALLSCFSKVYEKTILNKLRINLAEIDPLPKFQFGFRPGHSTSHALKILIKAIRRALRCGKTVGVIYFDVQKAFDLVWHNGLLYKLIKMGCDRWMIKIIASFLARRQFEVHVGDKHSNRHTTEYGVPQGSVLSPNLYNLFTSDIPDLGDIDISLYADDTAMSGTSRYIKGLCKRLRKAATKLIRYYTKWKIKINPQKTVVCFHSRRKTKQVPPRTLLIGGSNVSVTQNPKYLGVHLDNTLTMKRHIDEAVMKTNNSGRRIYPYLRRFSFATKKLKLKLYKTYVRPVLTYAAPILAGAAQSNLKKLQICQNKYLRIIMNRPRYTRIAELHELLRIETIPEFLNRLTTKFEEKCEFSENPLIAELNSN